jgi:hypothetical protein
LKQQHHQPGERMQTLRTMALAYPEAQEGIACAGTAAERRTIKARDKAFLFLGEANVMLKLGDSLAEAAELASREPNSCKAGASGWVTLTVAIVETLPPDLLRRWVDESYRLLAPKKLVALLEQQLPSLQSTAETGKKLAPKPRGAARRVSRRKPDV